VSGLYQLKPRFVARLGTIEDRLVARGIRADTLTFLSLVPAAVAGTAIVAGAVWHPAWWLLVGPCALLRMGLNALDGSVARRTGTSHARGEVHNELVDRAADALMLAPAAVVAPAWLAAVAVAAAWATSLVAVLTQAMTGERAHGGPMGKPDRVLVLSLAAAVAVGAGSVAFTGGLAVIVLGCAVTVVVRVRRLLAAADQQDGRVDA
jgi:CDP-diacylglycerol---glycerol-3-phosphate 3-phosphatidyltransferase